MQDHAFLCHGFECFPDFFHSERKISSDIIKDVIKDFLTVLLLDSSVELLDQCQLQSKGELMSYAYKGRVLSRD